MKLEDALDLLVDGLDIWMRLNKGSIKEYEVPLEACLSLLRCADQEWQRRELTPLEWAQVRLAQEQTQREGTMKPG